MALSLFRKINNTPDSLKFEGNYPWTEDEKTVLKNIWKHTALPQKEFNKTYGAMFLNTWLYLAKEPQNGWPESRYGEIKSVILNVCNTAIRIRQSKIIPKGLPTEDTAKLAEVMSFVVTVSVILEFVGQAVGSLEIETKKKSTWCPFIEPLQEKATILSMHPVSKSYGLLMLPLLLNTESLQWLSQEKETIDELIHALQNDPHSDIKLIIDMAKQLAYPDLKDKHCMQQQLPLTIKKAEKPVTLENEVATESLDLKPVLKPTLSSPKHTQPKGWAFIEWLRKSLEKKEIEFNTINSCIHVLANNKVFIENQQLFDAYEKVTGEPAKRVRNQVTRLGLHLIKRNGNNIYVAKVNEEKKQAGFVFKNSNLLWEITPSASKYIVVKEVE